MECSIRSSFNNCIIQVFVFSKFLEHNEIRMIQWIVSNCKFENPYKLNSPMHN